MRRQFIVLLFSRGLASVLSAVAFIYVGRIAGVEVVGLIGVVTSVTAFIFIVGDLGMSTFVAREQAKQHFGVVAGALRLNVLSSVALGLIVTLVLVGLWGLGSLPWALALIGISAAVEKNTETALSVPIAEGQPWIPAINVLLRRFFALVVFGGLVFAGVEPIEGFCIGLAVAAVIGQIHARVAISGLLVERQKITGADLADVLRRAWPFWATNVMSAARTLDVSIVGLLSSTYTAGLYAAATKVINPLRLVPSTLTSLVVPYASRQDKTGARSTALRLIALFSASLLVVIPASIFGEPLVVLLMGEDFRDAGLIFSILLIGLPFVALAAPLGSVLQGQNDERFVTYNGTIFAILTLAFAAVGTIVWGGEGAAIGVSAAYFIKCIALYIRIVRTLR